jgi:hypothetical protein
MTPLNILNHYWIIADSTTDVYSSASNTLVPVSNQEYVAWSASNTPSTIVNEAELAGALQANGSQLPAWLFTAPSFIQPTPATYSQDQLIAYTAKARRDKQGGDIVVNGLPFSTDPVTLGSLNSAYIYTQAKTGDTFSWKLPDGTFITLSKTDIEALQNAVSAFGQDCFVCEDATTTKIESGTITDLPAIDAEFAAISNTFTGLSSDAQKVRHKHK